MNTVTALKISFAVVIFVMSMVLLLDSLMAPDSVTEEVVASVRDALRARDGQPVTLRVEVWKSGFRVEEVPQ